MKKLKSTFNIKYYRYLQRSMRAVRDQKVNSVSDEIPLPTLKSEACIPFITSNDFDELLETVSNLPGSKDPDFKLDLFQLPLFKSLMFNILEKKLKFLYIPVAETVPTSADFTVGRITTVEKFLNIGKVEMNDKLTEETAKSISPTTVGYNGNFNKIIESLSVAFRIAINNYLIIPEDIDKQYSSSEGLQLLAFLNSQYICLPVNMQGHLLRNFFRNFLYYSPDEYSEKIRIIELYWPNLKQVQNILALTRLDDNGYSDFLQQNCKESPYNTNKLQTVKLENILCHSQVQKLVPANSASMNNQATTKFVEHQKNVVSKKTHSANKVTDNKRSSSMVVDLHTPSPKKAKLSEEEALKRIKELMVTDDENSITSPTSDNSKDKAKAPTSLPHNTKLDNDQQIKVYQLRHAQELIHQQHQLKLLQERKLKLLQGQSDHKKETDLHNSEKNQIPLPLLLLQQQSQNQQINSIIKDNSNSSTLTVTADANPKLDSNSNSDSNLTEYDSQKEEMIDVSTKEPEKCPLNSDNFKYEIGEYIDFHVVGPINKSLAIFAIERYSKYIQVLVKPFSCDIGKEAIDCLKFVDEMIKYRGRKILNVTFSHNAFQTSKEFNDYLSEHKIKSFNMTGQNFSIITLIRTLFTCCHQYLSLSKVPLHYWMFTISHTVCIYNQGFEGSRVITRGETLSPKLKWPIQHKSPYGCFATIKDGASGVFIGFSSNVPGAYILNWEHQSISKVVYFNSNRNFFPFTASNPKSPIEEPMSEFVLILDPKLIK